MNRSTWKLLDILEETSVYFDGKNIENPRLQAEILLADVLKMRRLDLYLQFERELHQDEVSSYREHVRQRGRNIPSQYITGTAGFRGLELTVSEHVLIPRPETEILVEVVLEYLADTSNPLVADVGSGSGAVALAMAQEHPSIRVIATDISADALKVARRNSLDNQVSDQVFCLRADLSVGLVPVRPHFTFDAIVSNPPYIETGAIENLQPEVRDNEPHLALDGGRDGLDSYRSIATQAGDLLKSDGLLIVEVGDGDQSAHVGHLIDESESMHLLETRPDLNQIPRVVVGRKVTA